MKESTNIDRKQMGAFIAALRKEKGLTQKALAERLHISDKAVSKWETAVSIPDADLLIPLAELLGVSVTELLLGRRMEPETPLEAGQVEDLVQQVIGEPAKMPRISKSDRRRNMKKLALSALFAAACLLLEVFLKIPGNSIYTVSVLALVFGIYFGGFAQARLPKYYDENDLNYYYDGFMRMQMPGVRFNNRTWPHILTALQKWSRGILLGYPPVHLLCGLLMPGDTWRVIELYVSLAVLFGTLFGSVYRAGSREDAA